MTPAPSNKATPVIEISKTATVEQLIDQVAQISTLDRPDLRYWQAISSMLEERPLEGIFYPSDRIQKDSTQPFPSADHVGKRLDEALVDDGDAIIYEYCSQGTWTVDMGTLDIPKTSIRIVPAEKSTPAFFNPESAEFKAKYQSGTHNAIKPISPSTGFTPSTSSQSTALTSFQSSTSTGFSQNGRVTSYTTPTRSPGTVGLNNL